MDTIQGVHLIMQWDKLLVLNFQLVKDPLTFANGQPSLTFKTDLTCKS